jgi:CubicO group peptidase (beta-lactamase class C family)
VKRYFLISILIIIANYTFAKNTNLPDIERKIDSLVYLTINPGSPGGVILVVSHDKILLKKTYGMMNLDYGMHVTDSTVFNLASISKQFTAYSILLLEKEGKLNLDDDIHKYLTDLPNYGQVITIRNMLHHTSGIPSTDVLRLLEGLLFEASWDSNDEINLICRWNKLNFKPNDEHLYSNANYFLLARIVEKISGKTFSEFTESNILKPLGMKNSIVYDKTGMTVKNRACGYRKAGESYIKINTESESIYGSTNLYTSVNDAAAWLQNLLEPNKDNKEIVDRLFKASDKLNNGDTLKYTFGFNLRKYNGIQAADHAGSTAGFRGNMMVFPQNDLAFILMFNNESFDVWSLASKITDLYLTGKLQPDIKKERKEVSINKDLLKKYAGNFLMPDGMELPFTCQNDTLWLIIPNGPKFVMHPESEKEFFIKEFDAQCSFVIGINGECNEITWHQSSQTPKGVRVTKHAELSDAEKYCFTGKYYNAILDVGYNVNLENNQLILSLPKTFKKILGIDPNIKLQFLNIDKFYTGNLGIVEFTRNGDNKVTGFKFTDLGRVRNVDFMKVN